jgi:outer membrane protein
MNSNLMAQQNRVWTLQECIDYAFKNNIQVRQTELSVFRDEVNLKQAQYNRLPNLNAFTGGSNNVGRSVNPFTNIIVDQDVTSQNVGVNSSITLFNGFNQTNTINQNRANLAKSEYDLEDIKNNTALNIVNFYLNILLAAEQYKNALLALETSEIQLDRTQKQFNAGAVAQQNLLQVKQQMANEELNLIRAENTLELTKLSLKQALQLPATTLMELEIPEITAPAETWLMLNLEDIYTGALSLPSVKSAEAQLESAEYGVSLARSGKYPSLTLSGGLNTAYSSIAPDLFPDPSSPTGFKENTYFNQLDFNMRRFVSLNLNIPIFNKFQNNSNVHLAKLSLDNAMFQTSAVKNQLRQNIEQAYYDARAAAKTYFATQKQVEALEESFRNVEQRFNIGASDPIEYNQIKNDYNRALNDLIRSKFDYVFKLRVLDFYQGKPLEL